MSMKKKLMKITLVAVSIFCLNLYAKINTYAAGSKNSQIITNAKANRYNRQYVHMYALQNNENLRTYNLGVKFFNLSNSGLTIEDFYESIVSHQFFIGSLENMSIDEIYVSFKDKVDYSFFIFETFQRGKSDFYIAYSGGLRHFTINTVNDRLDTMTCLCNGCDKNYPNLDSFIKCTLKSHTNKHLA